MIPSLCILLSAPALALDLSVRGDGTGDFATLQACADAALAGDRCLVEAGTYDERVEIRNEGEEGLPVVFQAVPGKAGEAVRVRGFSLYVASWVEIRGFEITNEDMSRDLDSSVHLIQSADVRIVGNSIHDTSDSCVELEAAGESTRVVVQGNQILRCGFAADRESSGVFVYGDDNRVEDNDISHVADFVLLFGDHNVMRRNRLHEATWDDYTGEPHIDGMQTYCSTAWHPKALRWALVEDNVLDDCPEADCHFVITQDEGAWCGHRDLLVRHNVVQELGSYLVISNDESDSLRYYNNTATRTGIAFDPQDWVTVGFYNGATQSKVINNIFVDTVREGGLVYEYDASSIPGSDHGYNLAWNSSCGADCPWGSVIRTDPGVILDQDPLHDPATGVLDPSSPAVDAGRALATVAAKDAGTGTLLLVDDAGFFQDGWAGIDPDVLAIGTVDRTVAVVAIDYDSQEIELAASVDRSPGDPVWLARNSSRGVLAGVAPDIGAVELGVPPEDTGDGGGSADGGGSDGGGSADGGGSDGGGTADGGAGDGGGTGDGGAGDGGGTGDGGSADGGSSGDGGSAGDGGAATEDPGCSCATSPAPALFLALFPLLAAGRRRAGLPLH